MRFALFLTAMIVLFITGCAAAPIRLEAEQGQLKEGIIKATTRPGFSGEGYVTEFDNTRGLLVFNFPAKKGVYEVTINYASGGKKGYELTVNGIGYEGMFKGSPDAFTLHKAGRVELKDGQNTISIGKGWAHYDIDFIELISVGKPKPPAKVPATLVDPNATAATKALMKRLVDSYGSKTISGAYEQPDVQLIEKVTGKTPVIFGGDLMRYSPSRVERGEDNEKEVEKLFEQAKKGQVLTISWHWNAPVGLIDKVIKKDNGEEIDCRWWKGFNANATTMDISKVLADPKGADYKLIIRDIDAIAIELKKFADADIPILWRPLHEAGGTWFWWGSKGPDNYIKLWRIMFDRLVNHHQLHNLIWVDSSDHLDWYPGDEVTDIVGIDRYAKNIHDPFAVDWDAFQEKHAGKKLLAITEFGGAPDVETMHRLGVYWSYFVSWGGTNKKMKPEDLKKFYNYKGVETLNSKN